MAEPLTMTEIKEYLRIDGEEDTPSHRLAFHGDISPVKNHLQAPLPSETPTPVKQALLILIGHFYEQRAGEDIPNVVYVLLSPYRAHLW